MQEVSRSPNVIPIVNAPLPDIQICTADEATFWPWRRWPEFANWTAKQETVVIIPIAGFADYGLTKGLDAEEAVLMAVLREASLKRPPDLKLLVVPPIRFALGPKASCAFAVAPDVACDLLEEVATWVAAAGFSRILFFNASPWNEEIVKAVGRDLRISLKIRFFCVQLSALGLDFNPARVNDRPRLEAVLAALGAGLKSEEGELGQKLIDEISLRFLAMLIEMRDLPALANEGNLPTKTWP